MIKLITAGESHGKGLTTIVTGFPANLEISRDYINEQLQRRQAGYGRGLRMKIETDQVEIISGIRHGKTLGSPISMIIWNKDWENWKESMSAEPVDKKIDKVTIPRPGHADLVGVTKYNFDDIRNSIERSSARETAARVAGCSIARKFLSEFGIHIGSFVESIGGIYSKENIAEKFLLNKLSHNYSAEKLNKLSDKSSVRVLDKNQEEKIIRKIKLTKKRGDTLGGTFYVIVTGLPPGIGSFVEYNTRLEAELSLAIMSIQAVKGVEIGLGFKSAELFGSEVHDEIILKGETFSRKTNRAGGIEGGISTGLPLIIRAAMKPIATLMSPIQSIDLSKMKTIEARRERSDFVAVPACAVIAESMAAWTIAKLFLQKFGGDSIEEVKDNYSNYMKKYFSRIKKNFAI
ncbi:MAG: chorismate synthase [Melioribacter sp.]|uniref:chorismate synthase n=1 Tax=Rosettibacter primus TaxID=3111523 RepID=UPI00247CD9F7|nr:chorismate synthase [Melioribacter sp.]